MKVLSRFRRSDVTLLAPDVTLLVIFGTLLLDIQGVTLFSERVSLVSGTGVL